MHSLGDVRAILDELIGLGLSPYKGGSGSTSTNRRRTKSVVPMPQQVKQLLNETAVASLGMIAAFRFTLKLEHCYTAEEFAAYFPDFAACRRESQGREFAEAIRGKRAAALLKSG